MKVEKLKRYLARAEEHAVRGREIIARQRALIFELERDERNTSQAESILRTMIETQRTHEDNVVRLREELSAEAPEQVGPSLDHLSTTGYLSNEGNQLLNSLQVTDLALIQPFLERVQFNYGQRLQTANRKMKTVHFLESGMSSVIAITRGGHRQAQVGLIGREGMTGLPIIFESERSPFDVLVEVEGQGQCISTEDFIGVMERSPSFRDAVVRYLQLVWIELAHTAVANAEGTIVERLARLLLMAQDRLGADEVPLTHEQIANMMAVRRAGVTIALQHLEAEGLVARDRGSITIVDRSGLEKSANHLY